MIQFDYSKLRGKIREFGTQEMFAEKLGISNTNLSEKLNNKTAFSQQQMLKAMEIFGLSENEIPTYFFTPKVT